MAETWVREVRTDDGGTEAVERIGGEPGDGLALEEGWESGGMAEPSGAEVASVVNAQAVERHVEVPHGASLEYRIWGDTKVAAAWAAGFGIHADFVREPPVDEAECVCLDAGREGVRGDVGLLLLLPVVHIKLEQGVG